MKLLTHVLSVISFIFLCILCTADFFLLHLTSLVSWENFILSICYIFWLFCLYGIFVVLSKKYHLVNPFIRWGGGNFYL